MAIEIIPIQTNNEASVDKSTFYKYLDANQPVVYTKLMDNWEAKNKWTDQYLLQTIKDHPVDVNMCTFGKMSDIVKMPFNQYYEKVQNNKFGENDSNIRTQKPYLRNFAMLDEFPVLKDDVKNDTLFNTDLHNMIIRGAFIGSKDSATNLHKDTGDNLVAIVRGSKYIVMVAPQDEHLLSKPNNDVNLAYGEDGNGVDIQNHPTYSNLQRVYTCKLEQGQALFIPVGWHHYIHNLELTISVSCWGKVMIN